MFLNGKRVQDPTNLDELSKEIDAALASKTRAEGVGPHADFSALGRQRFCSCKH